MKTATFPSGEAAYEPATNWFRGESWSTWTGPHRELIAVSNNGPSESWRWTARGCREPGGDWMADAFGWVNNSTREGAEKEALRFYLEKE